MKGAALAVLLVSFLPEAAPRAAASEAPAAAARAIEFRFTPTARAQIALWIEKPDGTFMGTVRLTQAVAVRGIGNRPGASQMNSGFRWPYGRRVDALPIWAHKRASAAGAAQFREVIFQHRTSEGCASNAGCGGSDSSAETYYCLSFNKATTTQSALDAVSCASAFSSDKGRYVTAADVAQGYSEPVEAGGVGVMRPLESTSLYPPRRDGAGCGSDRGCLDHPAASTYAAHVRQVMPDIDAITMATPPAETEQSILFNIPDDWSATDYVAWIEVNTEGDHNSAYSADILPTPEQPMGAWDGWALDYGYPYRGQPSVVYRVPFTLGSAAAFGTAEPTGYGDVNGFGPNGGDVHPMDGTITDAPNDPSTAGSGADRLRLVVGHDYRFQVNVRDMQFCAPHPAPSTPLNMNATPVADARHSHEWGLLHFVVPSSARPVDHYEARFSKTAIVEADPSTFEQALPAMAPQTDSVALMIPTAGAAGTGVDVPFGGMEAQTHYWIAVRAVDSCNLPGPYAVAEVTTTRINFTKLSGCFIATAAYGSALEPEVEALRTIRDALRPRSALFAVAADLYYRSGPAAAATISRSETTRALVRTLLTPAVAVARAAVPLVQR